VLNRKAHVVGVREALMMTAMWVAIALVFNVGVYFAYEHHIGGLGVYSKQVTAAARGAADDALLPRSGRDAAIMFFTGYLVEQMLSLDNMLVIAVILGFFRVPPTLQHRVLFWGIIGAVVLRGVAILAGTEILTRWHFFMYIFGAFLIFTAFKMLVSTEKEAHFEQNIVVRIARKLFNITPDYHADRFFVRFNGKLFLTPLMVALLVVDFVDLIFAVDSIPAIFGITLDPFLVFSSNCFAILGLRAIYFAVAALIRKFRYLKVSLVFVLGYIGIKMIAESWYKVSPVSSLITIAALIAAGVIASIVIRPRERGPEERPIDDLTDAAEETWRRSRKIVILIVGLTIVFIAAPLVGALPGPGGIFVAIGGLALLATEFVWARKLLATMKAKAMSLTGQSPTSTPPRLWRIAAVLAGYAAFVGLLVFAELTWGERFPKLEKNWYFLAIGPGIAVGYWVIMSLRRWNKFRRGNLGKSEAVALSGNPVGSSAAPANQGLGGQRQRAGSAE
jgi:tellurite resistance protein TerC